MDKFSSGGMGGTPVSSKMRALFGKIYNPENPLLFGKSGYYLAEDIL